MSTDELDSLAGCLVIVGAGTAGVECAFASRSGGWRGEILLISAEPDVPYHRPPLSKEMLVAGAAPGATPLRAAHLYDKKGIDLRLGSRVVDIDASGQSVVTDSRDRISYDRLILAVGGNPREMPLIKTLDKRPPNVHALRNLADCERLRNALKTDDTLMILGGGYIGLEVAAAATKIGSRVLLVESADRILARVTTPTVSAFFQEQHAAHGVTILTSTTIDGLDLTTSGKIESVKTSDGRSHRIDHLVVGIGLEPSFDLAKKAGLKLERGVVVDDTMTTSDSRILAVGDCVQFWSPIYNRHVRIESVSNAVETARRAAITLTNGSQKRWGVPWFWSNQYAHSLKIAGLSEGYDDTSIMGDVSGGSFAVEYRRNGRVIGVDAINDPAAFQAGKRRIIDTASI